MNFLFGDVKIKYSKKELDTVNMVVINKIGIPIFLIIIMFSKHIL